MDIQHRSGDKHTNADALSKIPVPGPCNNYGVERVLSELPCGGCTYCTRAHNHWLKIVQDFDDAIPLASWAEQSVRSIGRGLSDATPSDTGYNYPGRDGVSDIPTSWLEIICHDTGIRLEAQVGREKTVRVLQSGTNSGISLTDYSPLKLKKYQAEDPDMTILLNWLEKIKHFRVMFYFSAAPL